MLSPNILQCSTLNPFDWMVAYAALTLPHFCAEHLPVLQTPQVLSTFDAKIRQPLLSGQIDAVAAYLLALLPPPPSTTSEQPWILNSKTRKPPASTLPPNDDHIIQASSSQVAKSPFHLDNIHAAVANLASLLATADDLPKSPKGWIKAAILPTYAGKGVPGNFDTNTQEIVSNGVLTVASYGVHKPLSENLIAALVAFDNRKHRMRFDLGHFTPVDPNLLNSSFVSPLPLSLTPSVVPASPPTPLPWLSYLFCLTMHFPTLSIFVLHRPGRSSSVMVYDLDVNHPAPPLPLLKSSRPPPLILFLSLEGTLSVVTLMLVLSLISTKCSRITSPSLSTLRIIAMAPTLSLFPRNTSSLPLLSPPLAYNKTGLLLAPL